MSSPWSRMFAACCVLLAACFGGQTGQEDRTMTCNVERTPVAAQDETPLGFTAAELETVLSGLLASTVHWTRMSTTGKLAVELREVRSRRFASTMVAGCHDAIELDVLVLIATDDGLLHEEVLAMVTAQALEAWVLQATARLDALRGALEAADLALDLSTWRDPRLVFRLSRDGVLPDDAGVSLGGRILLDGDDPNPGDNQAPVSAFIAEVTP